MMTTSMVRALFGLAAVYDFVIGLVFLLLGRQLFELAAIPFPNHWGYIQFCALMLMIFGAMFATIAMDPGGNRNLMPFGMLLKVSYVSVVGYYWATSGCPMLFKPFVVIDLLMLVLFVVAYNRVAPATASPPAVA